MVFEEISDYERHGGFISYDSSGRPVSIQYLPIDNVAAFGIRFSEALEILERMDGCARDNGSMMFRTEITYRCDGTNMVPTGARITFLNHVDAMAYKMRWG